MIEWKKIFTQRGNTQKMSNNMKKQNTLEDNSKDLFITGEHMPI